MRKIALLPMIVFLVILFLSQSTLPVKGYSQRKSLASSLIVNVRRDISFGLPYMSSHVAGISSVVWGKSPSDINLTITLARSESIISTRTITSNSNDDFAVSMDQIIQSGDIITISTTSESKSVDVPAIEYSIDPINKVISGTGPAGITSTNIGDPNSLYIAFSEVMFPITTIINRDPALSGTKFPLTATVNGDPVFSGTKFPITTTANGNFSIDLNTLPYIAGRLGTLCYTTYSGDHIYQPIFVADPLARGKIDDWRADIILGQSDFNQITFDETVSNQLFQPGGVIVDRSVKPNRFFIYDAGNSRILGMNSIGVCDSGNNHGQACSTDSDCSQSTCSIQEMRSADIVIGQPDFNTSTCNGDSGYQNFPEVPFASASTLCGLREEQTSVSEAGSFATMAVDAQGNLYVTDLFNNRVLRFNTPFTSDKIADAVWGQEDFLGTTCNRGIGIGAWNHLDNRSLCLAPPPGVGDDKSGVAIDPKGNLWVADTQNHRVLRFPYDNNLKKPAHTADLVLGQTSFANSQEGSAINQMYKPVAVQVDVQGVVYVSDGLNNRVLVFEPPLQNGMNASRVLTTDVLYPTGLDLDLQGNLWVNDSGNNRLIRFHNYQQNIVIQDAYSIGGIGIDSDNNIYASNTGYVQEIHRYKAPDFTYDSTLLKDQEGAIFNQPSQTSFLNVSGLEIASGQLVASDGVRILFWNNPWSLQNGQPADGLIGVSDYQTQYKWGPWFTRMKADGSGKLWVMSSQNSPGTILAFQLPLATGEQPIISITSPIPILGGGQLTWSESIIIHGFTVQPTCDCLWLSDEDQHRSFRIRNVSTQPAVDIILGQKDATSVECNQGRGRDYPTSDSLCNPGALAFDPQGNLFLADHNAEFDGNLRLLEYDANTIPINPQSTVYAIPATRVFGRNGDFTKPDCLL